MKAKTRFLTAHDGVRVALHHFGGCGAPLLWGHANGFAAHCYLPLLALLSEHFDVWAWDARGQGHSEVPPGTAMGLDEIGGDAAMAVEAVRAATSALPHVASHSFSGVALLWAAMRHGLRFRSGCFFEPPLVTPAGMADPEEIAGHEARIAGTLRRRADWASPADFAARLASTPVFALLSQAALALHTRATLRPKPEGGHTLRCAPWAEAAIYATVRTAEPFLALRPIGVPLRFVASDATPPAPASPARLAQRPAAETSGAAFTELAGCSHLLALEKPAECAALIRGTAG